MKKRWKINDFGGSNPEAQGPNARAQGPEAGQGSRTQTVIPYYYYYYYYYYSFL